MSAREQPIDAEYSMADGSDDLRVEFDEEFDCEASAAEDISMTEAGPDCTGTDSVCC